MDVNLSFDAHVNDISAKVFSRLRSLWPNNHLLPWQTRQMMVKSLIMPLFTYCDAVYSSNLKAKSIRVLERVFAACVRFVFGIGRRDSTDEFINRILGCSLMDFLKYRSLVMVFKLVMKEAPQYLLRSIKPSTRSNQLIIPQHSTTQYNKSFFVKAVSRYNLLPNSVKCSQSLATFKIGCFDHITSHPV